MKKHLTRAFSLLLALIMVVGAVPFAMAAEPTVEIRSNKDNVWPGQTVTLTMEASEATSGVAWDNGERSNSISYTVPEDAVGTDTVGVTVSFGGPSDQISKSASITLNINEPAESISISGGASEAAVGESVKFDATTAPSGNDSEIAWSVSPAGASVSNGRFKATEEGTYTVTATAKNGGAIDPVSDSATITVKAAAYRVTVKDATVPLTSGTSYVSYTVTAADGSSVSDADVRFSASGSVLEVDAETGLITPLKAGTAEVTVSATIDGETYTGHGDITVSDKGTITCAQDMDEVNGDSVNMTFVLSGVEANSVLWSVSVSGEEEFSVSESSFTGTNRATVTVEAEDGIGLAKVDVTADWGSGSTAKDTFYISFYRRNSFTVEVADGVDEFDFDETGVFSGIDGYSAVNAAKKSLYSLITDGAGTRVVFTEDRTSNSRVGRISYDTKSSFAQYDPDDENDYALSAMEDLSFEVLSEGEYKLNFEVYDQVSGVGLATSRGTITIVTGEGGASDIEYRCTANGSVKLDPDDFEEFWEEEADAESGEEFNYVTFDVSSSTDMEGTLYHDKSVLKAAWKCYFDFDDDKNTYDLAKVSYKPGVNQTGDDSVGFTCYGDEGTKVSGVVSFKLTNGEIKFTDVKSTDWFYDEVAYVYEEGIMNGTTTTTFSPNDTLTRGMVVTMLWRIAGEPAVSSADTFSDVSYGAWYYSAVEWAAKNGIVNGVGNGKFAPDNAITREQLAAILYRYTTEYEGSTVSGGSFAGFSDADKVSEYAETAMKWAVGAGIITGSDGKLMPAGNATRAQAAAMFARFMEDAGNRTNDRDDDEDEDEIAYVVGTKYHLDEDCAGKNAKEKKLSVAERNYTPCSKCVDD
ncbi:MAG: S-layer homology domain-containing protein [Oscillospiraceae bacterium]|nr:S-layer homology domain-containing protein [Oscillospiraceae bacterium]